MFCYQCEQSKAGNCHSAIGVCGKDEETAAFQDVLLYVARGISVYADKLRDLKIINNEYDVFVIEALFTTVTNVNFDPNSIKEMIKKGYIIKEKAKQEYEEACISKNLPMEKLNGPTQFIYPESDEKLHLIRDEISIEKRMQNNSKLITGLQELIVYGIKGLASYTDHAHILNFKSDEIFGKIHKILAASVEENDPAKLLSMALETGELNLQVMELLDNAHTSTFGHPVPTKVNINPIKGKAILVSGHDLKDIEELLIQTEGKDVNIYTHGEMLPAHGYPKLNKFKHLVGNYGGAWQDQHKEFDAFPGAILMTTNCIQKPRESYKNRIFTSGLVQWPDVKHIDGYDFSEVIESALNQQGFTGDSEPKYILTGFGHNAVMNVADSVINLVKNEKINHFYLIGGCDGAKPGRNYYTEFAEKVPQDSVILTLACGKFRFNKMEFGDIEGIPRLLDIGQCNDAYSAIRIASGLAEAFGTDVNGLPLSFILSWYEQKAVAILLTLLHLGIKNIKLGPTLPQFLEPEAINILVEKFNIAPIRTVEEDIAESLA